MRQKPKQGAAPIDVAPLAVARYRRYVPRRLDLVRHVLFLNTFPLGSGTVSTRDSLYAYSSAFLPRLFSIRYPEPLTLMSDTGSGHLPHKSRPSSVFPDTTPSRVNSFTSMGSAVTPGPMILSIMRFPTHTSPRLLRLLDPR